MEIRSSSVTTSDLPSAALTERVPESQPQFRRETAGHPAIAHVHSTVLGETSELASVARRSGDLAFTSDEVQPLLFTDDQIREAARSVQERMKDGIDQVINDRAMGGGEPQSDRVALNEVSGICTELMQNRPIDLNSLSPLARHIAQEVSTAVARDTHEVGRVLHPEERLQAIQQALANLHRESWGDAARRWGGNLTAELLRTGVIVAGATALRQYVGAVAERALGCDLGARHRVSTFLCGISMLQNVAGLLRDEYRGTATAASRHGRVNMMAHGAVGLALTIAANNGTLPVGGGSLLASAAAQASSYVFARDFAQIFFPMRSNNECLDDATIEAARMAYAFNQFLVGTSMDQVPNTGFSGAVRNMPPCPTIDAESDPLIGEASGASTGWNATGPIPATSGSTVNVPLTYGQMVPHTAARAVINALGEVTDNLTVNAVQRHAERARAHQAFSELRAAGRVDDVVASQTACVQRLWRAAARHEQEGVLQGLSGDGLSSHVRTQMTQEMERLSSGLRVWVEPRIPTRDQVLDQVLTTAAARSQAFGSAYTATVVLDHMLPASLSPRARGALLNGFVGSYLYQIYGPFAHMHESRPASARAEDVHTLRRRRPGNESAV